MKKFILSTALLISVNSFANELINFDAVKNALVGGHTIHIVVDFSKCVPSNQKMTGLTMIGIFTPDTLQVSNDHIATSLTHFTLNNPRYLGKPVYEFVRYTLNDNNVLTLNDQVLDAVSYAPLGEKVSFNCHLMTDVKIYD